MTVRALLTALLLGGAVVGSRLLAGPLAVPPQDASFATARWIVPAQSGQAEAAPKRRAAHNIARAPLPIRQSADAASTDAAQSTRYSS